MTMSACQSPEQHVQSSPIFVHVKYGRAFTLLWWCCDMLCTSGYTDDVTFAHNGKNRRREDK